MKKLLLFAFVISFVASLPSAFAAGKAEELEPPKECTGLKFGTGQKGKGYSKLFADINKMCGQTVELCENVTHGALDNLTAMSTNDADVGLADVVSALSLQGGDENIMELQAVMSLNHNFLHALVNTTGYTVETKKWGGLSKDTSTEYIRKFTDLRGKTVALVGSAALVGRKLNDMMGLGISFVDAKDDAEAISMLTKKSVQGVFTMSGWPSGAVDKLASNSNITLIPFDGTVAAPYLVRPINYKNLGVYNVQSVAIPNLLLTRPFRAGGEKAVMVSRLKSCLKTNLVRLQEGSFQAAWKEVKDFESVQGWAKFQPSGNETKTAKK